MVDIEDKSALQFAAAKPSPSNSNLNIRRTHNGVKLEPQPTDDPRDPLNWPLAKKASIIAIISLAGLIGYAQVHANQSAVTIEANVYHTSPIQISNTVSAAIAGLATGPIFAVAASNYVGRCSVMFWATLGAIACASWSSAMRSEDDYVPFAISRWLAGTFASAPSAMGGGVIMEMFFLHQRGRVFGLYQEFVIFGAPFGTALCGFIIQSAPWPAVFWWTIGAHGLVAVLMFLFVEDTTYPRDGGVKEQPVGWLANRVATFLPGHKIVYRSPTEQRGPFDAIAIGLQPVTMLAGLAIMLVFGWAVATTVLLPVYLEAPVHPKSPSQQAGYGFTPLQVSYFTFFNWVSLVAALSYGILLNDRIPLWWCRRNGGIWRPEYRLWPLMLPPLVLIPSMLGLYGAALQHRLHYMVLAFSLFMSTCMELAMVPVIVSYVSECFIGHSAEVTTILSLYRLSLGLTVTFYIKPWSRAVGVAWAFGMMGFFSLVGFAALGLLIWKGRSIRRLSSRRFTKSEDGDKLFGSPLTE